MAIISFTNYKRGQTTGCMGAVMRYTMQDKKTEFEGQKLITGINCQPESVYADFMTTKRLHHKTDGVLFYHMVTKPTACCSTTWCRASRKAKQSIRSPLMQRH